MAQPPGEMSDRRATAGDHRPALQVAGSYAIVAIVYILLSDWLTELAATDIASGAELQTMKGIGFVIVTAALLHVLLKRQFRSIRESGLRAATASQRLKAVSDALPNPLVILDTHGRLTHWNALARETSGYSDEMLTDKSAAGLVHPEDRHAVESAIAQVVEAGMPASADGRLVSADGRLTPHRWHAAPLRDDDGGLTGGVVIGVDLTDLREAEEKLRNSLLGVRNVLHQSVDTISLALEKRDPYTAGHQRRVAALAVAIAREIGMDADAREGLKYAALLHDIGKIAVPSDILTKPGRLTDDEYKLVQAHVEDGYDIVRKVDFPWPIAQMIRQHHERLDGSGYPHEIEGEAIIPGARILAVADVIEAMTSHRPYRAGLDLDVAMAEIRDGAGTRYDSEIAAACERVFSRGFVFPEAA